MHALGLVVTTSSDLVTRLARVLAGPGAVSNTRDEADRRATALRQIDEIAGRIAPPREDGRDVVGRARDVSEVA